MDSIDYYDRYAVPYYEETVELLSLIHLLDIIKTTYTGDTESMAKVVATVPSTFRIVIQGGDACKTLDDYLQMTRDAMDCGVGGVTMGRFVWDYKDVTALVIALRYIIHEGYSVKEAKELLAQLENDKNYSEF